MASQARVKQYEKSIMKGYVAAAMFIRYSQLKPNRHWEAICRTETLAWRGNGDYVENDETWEKSKAQMKFFLLDHVDKEQVESELKKCKDEKERDAKAVEMLGSLTKFVAKHPHKKLYLRCMGGPRLGYCDQIRLFTEDLHEVLPLILKKQKVPAAEYSDYLEKLREEFKNPQLPTHHRTINLTRLDQILIELGVNKALLNIVEDPFQGITRVDNHHFGRVFGFFGPNNDEVMDSSQSINYLFQNLVVGIDWTEPKTGDLKKKILEAMEECRKAKDEFYITKTHLLSLIAPIKSEFSLGPSEDNLKTYMFNGVLGTTECSTGQYEEIAKKFNLPTYTNPQSDAKKGVLSVWMARFFLALGWTQTFLPGPATALKDLMMNTLLYLAPPPKYPSEGERFLASVLRNQQSGQNDERQNRNVNGGFEAALREALRKKRAAEKAAAGGQQ